MPEKSFVLLPDRGVLAVEGEDRVAFLQGLISNDVTKVSGERAIWAALLTPQGKFLHEFFVSARGETLYLEGEAARLADLQKRLSIYRLRSKVTIANVTDRFSLSAAFGGGALQALGLSEERGTAKPFRDGIAFVDPRLSGLGARVMLPREAKSLAADGFQEVPFEAYDRMRLELGVPDGSRDMPIDKAILLEAGFDELDGVDWKKGCYIGQELTARTKYRGIIRKRLMPVRIDGPTPEPGTLIMLGEKEAGEMRSGRDGLALALLRFEALEEAKASNAPLIAEGATVHPQKPAWASF